MSKKAELDLTSVVAVARKGDPKPDITTPPAAAPAPVAAPVAAPAAPAAVATSADLSPTIVVAARPVQRAPEVTMLPQLKVDPNGPPTALTLKLTPDRYARLQVEKLVSGGRTQQDILTEAFDEYFARKDGRA